MMNGASSDDEARGGRAMQAIEAPFGVTVFGSTVLRTEPDLAEIELGVGRIDQTAEKAFKATQEGVTAVRRSLRASGLPDESVEVARVTLESAYDGFGPSRKFVGYKAFVRFRLVITALDNLEATLSAAVSAGANDVQRVTYQSSRLKELRAEARRNAVLAARDKAEIYCEAAGVRLGHVLHIEDRNPEMIHRGGHGEGTQLDEHDAESVTPAGLASGSLVITAAVTVGFALLQD
jgi:uncharacterized protein YggE